jgi:membrane protease YdiL (CAAX protease family)
MDLMPSDAGQSELLCKACGERNPPRFELCWNCGKSLEGASEADPQAEPDEQEIAAIESNSSSNSRGRLVDWCELAAVIFAACAYPILYHLVYEAEETPTASVASALLAIPRYAGWSILLWLLVRRDRRVLQPKPLRDCRWYQEVFFALLIVAAKWTLGYFVAALAIDFGMPREKPPIYVELSGAGLVIAYATRLFFAAVYEEILFRVYLQSKLESLLGDTILPVLISSTLFTAIHGYPPRSALQLFASGILMGIVYRVSFRVPRLVLAHWCWNLLTLYLRQH